VRRFSFVTAALFISLAACNKPQNQSTEVSNGSAGDPASGNLASADQSGSQPDAAPPAPYYDQNSSSEPPVEASEPPPPLPDYSQPPAPGDNYLWTPGYWGYASSGYYWVPGAWIVAPYVGALWTPPWWGYDNNVYQWHSGYWGPHIGFYGGINYGYGYTGRGYYGAYWNNGTLDYNRSVTNVDVSVVHNIYNYAVPGSGGNRVSYNGGRGGADARPTPQELAVARDPRIPPVSAQLQHAREASSNRAQFATAGGGHPAALVAARPIPTTYKAPEARPPAAAMRAAQPAPETPSRPEERTPSRAPEPESRTTGQRPAPAQIPENRPAQAARPEARPAPARPEARPQEAARPQARPAPAPSRPAVRPQEAARPQPAAHPQPTARPEAPRPEAARPAAPRQEAKPKPAAPPRPAPKPKEEEHKP
jgi:WXXGXW repeat (2 copies)